MSVSEICLTIAVVVSSIFIIFTMNLRRRLDDLEFRIASLECRIAMMKEK